MFLIWISVNIIRFYFEISFPTLNLILNPFIAKHLFYRRYFMISVTLPRLVFYYYLLYVIISYLKNNIPENMCSLITEIANSIKVLQQPVKDWDSIFMNNDNFT